MIINNFLGFFTVTGFFIGMLFSIMGDDNAIELVINSILFTMGFYSFSQLILAFYVKYLDVKTEDFPKNRYEKELDSYIEEMEEKEERVIPQKEIFEQEVTEQLHRIEKGNK
jgi:hypothetical protein